MLRQETADQYPQLVEVLNQLAGKITDDEMRQMNYDVNVEGENPEQVATEYLKQAGLL
ncbi:Substrate binding domain of ABC-type glycine betaine transport system [compost metagenome]